MVVLGAATLKGVTLVLLVKVDLELIKLIVELLLNYFGSSELTDTRYTACTKHLHFSKSTYSTHCSDMAHAWV